MRQVEKKTIEVEQNVYSFYCDRCGEFLGESVEFDDGYVPDIWQFVHSIRFGDKWYEMSKHFCDECKKKQIKDTEMALINLGYKEDK